MNRLVTYVRQLLGSIEQVPYRGLVRQHPADNSQDIEGRPLEFAFVLNDGYHWNKLRQRSMVVESNA
ncbi:MAG: hypothetical protein MJ000_12210 [Bacteroidales bacterium]|nr:hypothetical protein [Bacteroidales bacterium]